MKPNYTVENVTPELAWEYLMTSKGNRHTHNEHISMLAAQMKAGKWLVNNDAISFDTAGVLIDGHHRLAAVVLSFCTVQMGVLRNIDPSARTTINIGVARTLADHLRFAGVDNSNQRAAYLSGAVRLVVGSTVALKTTEAYDQWLPSFKDAIDKYFELGCQGTGAKHLRSAKVAAPLIVAYKVNPELMEIFYASLRDGANLKPNNPALKLREYLLSILMGENSRTTNWDGIAGKVFAAAKAFLENRSLAKVQSSETATDFFRAAYSRGTVGKLATEARALRRGARAMAVALDFPVNQGPAEALKAMTLKDFQKSVAPKTEK